MRRRPLIVTLSLSCCLSNFSSASLTSLPSGFRNRLILDPFCSNTAIILVTFFQIVWIVEFTGPNSWHVFTFLFCHFLCYRSTEIVYTEFYPTQAKRKVEGMDKILFKLALKKCGVYCTDFYGTRDYWTELCGDLYRISRSIGSTGRNLWCMTCHRQPPVWNCCAVYFSCKNYLIANVGSRTDGRTWSPHKPVVFFLRKKQLTIFKSVSRS